ncbi:MAG: glycerate kinase, partial [Planctomycetota bacterium]
FKDALPAAEACRAVARGVRQVLPEAEVDLCPMADGGEGTAAALAAGYETAVRHEFDVTGPLPESTVRATLHVVDDGRVAIADMATAAGLELLDRDRRNPLHTTTYGVGELVAHAAELGCREFIVGLGGSATCDGGLGAAQALGLRLTLDGDAGELQRPVVGSDLVRIASADVPVLSRGIHITCLCDVDNPLVGPNGAAPSFAMQKGASQDDMAQLAHGLERLIDVTGRCGDEPFHGAAGGLAFGLSLAAKAEARPGVEAVLATTQLAHRLRDARLCFTGEGRFDTQSFRGKVVSGVGRLARQADVPTVALVGSADAVASSDADTIGLDAVLTLADGPATLDELLQNTEERLENVASQVTRLVARAEAIGRA